jgi:hypothetical protein
MELESVEDKIKIFARRCKNSLNFTNLIVFSRTRSYGIPFTMEMKRKNIGGNRVRKLDV